MSFQTFVTERLAAITALINAISTNAKKIEELPIQEVLNTSSKIHVSKGGISESLEIQKIIDAFNIASYKELISVGSIEIVGQDITLTDIVWKIDGIHFTANFTDTTPLCTTGNNREDIFVGLPSGLIERISGVESDTVIYTPTTPIDAVFITKTLVTDSGVGVPSEPIIGTNYVEKETFSPFTYNNTGVVGSLSLNKQSAIKITGTVSELGNIIKNNPQHYYPGQIFVLLDNTTAGNIKLPHMYTAGGSGSIAWFHPDAQDYYTVKDEVVLFVLDYIGSQKVYRRLTSGLKNKSVTLEKLQDFPANHILGRLSETDGQAQFLDAFDILLWLGLDDVDANLYLKADKSNTYTKSEVDAKVASIYRPKGSKATYAELPTTGQLEGDVWNVIADGKNYAWVLNLNNTGVPGWDDLGGTIDLSAYSTTAQSDVKYLQNSNFKQVNANYTLLQADSGKYILISGNSRTVTIPNGLTDEFHITLDFEGTGGLITDDTTTMYGDNIGFDNGTANNYNIPQNGSFYFIRNTVDGRIRTKGDYI